MSEDYTNQPEWREWEAEVQEHLVPKLVDSAATVTLVPRGETDVKFAVELGLSIMMDKPILAVVNQGTEVPERLARVADRIIVGEIETPAGQELVRSEVEAFMRDFVDEE